MALPMRTLIRSLSPTAIAFEMALASLRSTPDYARLMKRTGPCPKNAP